MHFSQQNLMLYNILFHIKALPREQDKLDQTPTVGIRKHKGSSIAPKSSSVSNKVTEYLYQRRKWICVAKGISPSAVVTSQKQGRE